MTALQILADWIATKQSSHSALARERAKQAFLDTIAAALLGGKVGPETFESAAIAQAPVGQLIDKITVKPLEPSPWDGDIGPTGPTRLTATLHNGHKVQTFVGYHKGTPENPMTAHEVMAKFESCVRGNLPGRQVELAKAALATFEEVANVRDFMKVLAVARKEQTKGTT